MLQSAKEQIASQTNVNEIDDEGKLLEIYASRLAMPTFAYLRRDALINGQMHEALAKCIYVGPRGSTEEANKFFICQVNMCPCRQMMRYARGSRMATETEYWNAPRFMPNMNVVSLQRDVIRERRDHIRSDHTLLMGRSW